MPRRSKVGNASPAAKHSRDDRRVKLTAPQLEIALLVADGLSTVHSPLLVLCGFADYLVLRFHTPYAQYVSDKC